MACSVARERLAKQKPMKRMLLLEMHAFVARPHCRWLEIMEYHPHLQKVSSHVGSYRKGQALLS